MNSLSNASTWGAHRNRQANEPAKTPPRAVAAAAGPVLAAVERGEPFRRPWTGTAQFPVPLFGRPDVPGAGPTGRIGGEDAESRSIGQARDAFHTLLQPGRLERRGVRPEPDDVEHGPHALA